MRYALLLPQTNQLASTDSLSRTAVAAEQLGFDAVAVHDGIAWDGWSLLSGPPDPAAGGDARTLFEPLETLAFIAARTSRVRLLVGVIVAPLREPILLAKQAATLDVLSGGRLVLGIGVGAPAADAASARGGSKDADAIFRAMGVLHRRGARTDEALQAIEAVWTQERASFAGRHVSFADLAVYPKPLQRPRPPVWIGGRSAAAHERAAKFGDAWAPSQISATDFAAGVERVRKLFEGRGRAGPTERPVSIFARLAASDAAAHAVARPALAQRYPDDATYRARTVVGGPDTFVVRVEEFAAAGATFMNLYFIYRTIDDLLGQMELLSREVMPRTSQV